MVTLFNSSLEFGGLFNQMTTYFTGDLFLTLLMVLVFFLMIALIFRIPLILGLIVVLPLMIVFADFDYSMGFYGVLGVAGLIIGFMLARSIFAYR